jgi:hypothetical protein
MAFPTPKVYIAFDDGPYVASPTWTEVTEYVFSADVSRGRADDYSNVVGTASVVLNNNTRLFDPFNTAGTYYGKLLPRRQIKIEAISNSTTFSVFRGYIAAWPAQFNDAGKTGTVSLQCFDALALLAQEQLPDTLYDYTQSLAPIHYYRLDDPQGQGFLKDLGSRPSNLTAEPIGYAGDYSKVQTLIPSLNVQATQFVGYGYLSSSSTANTDTGVTTATWITPTDGNALAYGFDSFLNGVRVLTYVFAGTSEIWGINNATGFTYKTAFPATIDLSTGPFHLAVTFTGSTLRVYVNGQNVTGTVSALGVGVSNREQIYLYGPQMQEVSVYNKVLTAGEITNLYNYSVANIIETTAARFNRLIAFTSFPSALKSATATPVASVGNLSQVGNNLAAELALVNNSEGGAMYVTKAGTITLTDRNYYYTNTKSITSQATLATGSIGYEPQVSIEYSGDNLRNVYQVDFTGGGTWTASNAASVTAYGRNTTSLQTQLSTIDQAQTLADYQVAVSGTLLSDTSPVKVGVAGVTADWTTLLGLELFEKYTISVNPSTGSTFTQTQLINQITHSIVPGKYEMTIDGSARYCAWFILDQSTLDGPDVLQ